MLRFQRTGQVAYPGDISARPIEACDRPRSTGSPPNKADDRNRRRRRLGRKRGRLAAGRNDHGHLLARASSTASAGSRSYWPSRPAIFYRDILAFDESALVQAAEKCGDKMGERPRRSTAEEPDDRLAAAAPAPPAPAAAAPPSREMNWRRLSASFDHLIGPRRAASAALRGRAPSRCSD